MNMKALEAYSKGEWVSRMPRKPGVYWLLDDEHEFAGTTTIVIINGQLEDMNLYPLKHRNKDLIWKGYYWSEPIPKPEV